MCVYTYIAGTNQIASSHGHSHAPSQLDLSNNRLTGSLPRDIHADFMETFRLSNNQLSGTLDFDGKMGSSSLPHGFTELYLNDNKFTGQLPQSLSKMTSLKKCVY